MIHPVITARSVNWGDPNWGNAAHHDVVHIASDGSFVGDAHTLSEGNES